jgi:hypothetical protein
VYTYRILGANFSEAAKAVPWGSFLMPYYPELSKHAWEDSWNGFSAQLLGVETSSACLAAAIIVFITASGCSANSRAVVSNIKSQYLM